MYGMVCADARMPFVYVWYVCVYGPLCTCARCAMYVMYVYTYDLSVRFVFMVVMYGSYARMCVRQVMCVRTL